MSVVKPHISFTRINANFYLPFIKIKYKRNVNFNRHIPSMALMRGLSVTCLNLWMSWFLQIFHGHLLFFCKDFLDIILHATHDFKIPNVRYKYGKILLFCIVKFALLFSKMKFWWINKYNFTIFIPYVRNFKTLL